MTRQVLLINTFVLVEVISFEYKTFRDNGTLFTFLMKLLKMAFCSYISAITE